MPLEIERTKSVSQPASVCRWRLVDPSSVQMRYFGDEAVLFHLGSGSLHLLTRQLADALHSLRSSPTHANSLSKSLLFGMSEADGSTSMESIEVAFTELAKFGIVARLDEAL